MKKKYIWTIMMITVMALTACTVKPEESRSVAESASESRTESEEVEGKSGAEPGKAEAESRPDAARKDIPENKTDADHETAASDTEEVAQGDPVIGIVDRYENDLLVIRDADDEDIILYFSTKNAQVIEGDTPIAAGDTVEITYEGVQGDKEHPGTAVKVVAESMMYNLGGNVQ